MADDKTPLLRDALSSLDNTEGGGRSPRQSPRQSPRTPLLSGSPSNVAHYGGILQSSENTACSGTPTNAPLVYSQCPDDVSSVLHSEESQWPSPASAGIARTNSVTPQQQESSTPTPTPASPMPVSSADSLADHSSSTAANGAKNSVPISEHSIGSGFGVTKNFTKTDSGSGDPLPENSYKFVGASVVGAGGDGRGNVAAVVTESSRPPVPDPHSGLGYSRWLRGRILSTLCLSLYIAKNTGYTPLLSQYLYQNQMPDDLKQANSSNNLNASTGSTCSTNRSDPHQEEISALQSQVSLQMLIVTLASTGPSIFSTLMLGAYSDVVGRKFVLYLPTAMSVLEMVGICLIMQFDVGVWWVYGSSVINGFGGASSVVLMGTFAYNADLTPPNRSRTTAINIIESSLLVASAVTDVGLGYCIKLFGYKAGATLLAVCVGVAFLCVVFLPETVKKAPPSLVSGDGQPQSSQRARCCVCTPCLHVKHVFAFYFTAGSAWQRARFGVAMLMLTITFLTILGRGSTETLYQINRPFCWDSVTVGLFGGLGVMVRAVGSVLTVHLLQSCCQFSDATVGLLSIILPIFGNMLYGLAYLPSSSYINSVLLWSTIGLNSTVSGTVATTRAILSKMASSSRQGALFASIAVIETLSSLLATTMYNNVYSATLDVMKGAAFLLSASLALLNVILFIVFKAISAGYSEVWEEKVIEPPDNPHPTIQSPHPSIQSPESTP